MFGGANLLLFAQGAVVGIEPAELALHRLFQGGIVAFLLGSQHLQNLRKLILTLACAHIGKVKVFNGDVVAVHDRSLLKEHHGRVNGSGQKEKENKEKKKGKKERREKERREKEEKKRRTKQTEKEQQNANKQSKHQNKEFTLTLTPPYSLLFL